MGKTIKESLEGAIEISGQVQAQISEDKNFMNQVLGQIQAAETIRKVADVISFSKLAEIKKKNLFKCLAGQTYTDSNGKVWHLDTWEGFCKGAGISQSKAYEDIKLLQELGAEALDAMKQMGIGYRQLRQYRKLPDNEKAALIEAAQTGDKESFLDLAEDIIEKHVKEKEAKEKEKESLEKTLENLKSDLEARDMVLQDKNQRLDNIQEELLRLKNIPPDQERIALAEREDAALKELWMQGLKFIGGFNAFLAAATGILNRDDISKYAQDTVHELASSMASHFAEELLNAGIDVDFRLMAYPEDCPQRGDDIRIKNFKV